MIIVDEVVESLTAPLMFSLKKTVVEKHLSKKGIVYRYIISGITSGLIPQKIKKCINI